jgi:hypothetical protein
MARRAAEILSHVTQRPQALFFGWGIHHQWGVSIIHAGDGVPNAGLPRGVSLDKVPFHSKETPDFLNFCVAIAK